MIFKNKLIIYITSAGFIPPQLEYPSFGELEIYLVGKMYGGGGYVWISYYLCAIKMLSLYTIRISGIHKLQDKADWKAGLLYRLL